MRSMASDFLKLQLAITLLLFTAAMPAPAAGQGLFAQAESLLETEALPSLSVFHPGSTGFIAIKTEIKEGWHINSNSPLDRYLIPTVVSVTAPEGIEIVSILYPAPENKKLEISDGVMPLYHGTVHFGAAIRISRDIEPGSYTIKTVLEYQGCNDFSCLEPARSVSTVTLKVGGPAETTEALHPEIFSAPPFVDGNGNPVIGATAAGADRADESIGRSIERRGYLLTFFFIFLMGLALNLTPCIYPLIPITISYFGGQSDGKSSRPLLLAVVYVFGMSITYSILGTVAATTGSLFGSALQNMWVIVFIAAVMVTLATSMFGLWEIRLPGFLTRRTGSARQGYLGALFMGLTVGLLAAPCIGPFVLALLTYVGELGKPILGFLMFFTLAWGMGLPFIVLATASGSISRLPRSGHWMEWVRKIFGFILLMMAVYFAVHLLGRALSTAGYAAVSLVAGIYLGWIAKTPGTGRGFKILKKIVGIAWMAIAIAMILRPGGFAVKPDEKPAIAWTQYSNDALAAAREAGRPVMIDFSADWCIPCHELEHGTFTDPGLIALSKEIVTLKVDLTKSGEVEGLIKKEFGIRGVPTIIFIGRDGNEIPGSRITGFAGPERFREILEKM